MPEGMLGKKRVYLNANKITYARKREADYDKGPDIPDIPSSLLPREAPRQNKYSIDTMMKNESHPIMGKPSFLYPLVNTTGGRAELNEYSGEWKPKFGKSKK